MTDSNQIKKSGVSVKLDDAENKETEKPRTDGGNSGNEKKEQNAEKKSRLNEEVKSVLLFTAASVFAGYASFILGGVRKSAPISGTSLLLALGAMIIIFLVSAEIVKKLLGRKDMKWIMGNGGAIYLFLWFVSWIIFYNAL